MNQRFSNETEIVKLNIPLEQVMSTSPESRPVVWHDVAAQDQLDPDFPLGVEIGTRKVGVFMVEGRVHALEDVCPHAYALLSQGFQEDGKIECPLHEAQFDIATGKCLNEIGQRDLRCYAVKVEQGRVHVAVPAGDAA